MKTCSIFIMLVFLLSGCNDELKELKKENFNLRVQNVQLKNKVNTLTKIIKKYDIEPSLEDANYNGHSLYDQVLR